MNKNKNELKTNLHDDEYVIEPDLKFEKFYEKNKRISLKSIKHSKKYLRFSKSQRDYFYEVRFLYLTVSELSGLKLEKLKNFINIRKFEVNAVQKIRSNYTLTIQQKNANRFSYSYKYDCINRDFNFFYIYNHVPYNIVLSKLANILMYDGQKTKAYKILNKFFELLRLKYHILNPVEHLVNLLYYNLVPLLGVKVLKTKSKKVIGIPINIEKRLSNTLKVFIRGTRSKKLPIVYSLIYEFINLMFGKGVLVEYNKKILNDINEFRLYKYLKLEDGGTYLPENELLSRNIFENKINFGEDDEDLSGFTLTDIVQLDWKNFDVIIENLKTINLIEIINFQNCFFAKLKEQVLLKYTFISCNSNPKRVPISDSLMTKYSILKKHKSFELDFLSDDYLNKRKFDKNYYDDTKYEAIFENGRLIQQKLLPQHIIEKNEKLTLLKVLEETVDEFTRNALVEHKYINPCMFNNNLNVIYRLETCHNKFNKFLDNPVYFHLDLSDRIVKEYLKNNVCNYYYFLVFVYELKKYINPKISKNLIEEDYLQFFECRNPKLIDLELNQEDFIENEYLFRLFAGKTFWRPVGSSDDELKIN